MENEKDTGILKGQLDELKGILNVIQTQTSSIEQNEYGDMVVLVFLKEIINYLENMNYLSEINTWERKIFRLGLNKFIVKEKILENGLLLKTVIPVPICENLVCLYRVHDGYQLDENNYIIKKDCELKNSIYCKESKKVGLCKNMTCKENTKFNHTNEILIFDSVMFLYPKKTINLFNVTFIKNKNYMIRSKEEINFSFEGKEYVLIGNNLVNDIEIVSYPLNSAEIISTMWTLMHTYKETIVIAGTTIVILIGSALLIYLVKNKCVKVNNDNSDSHKQY